VECSAGRLARAFLGGNFEKPGGRISKIEGRLANLASAAQLL